MTASHVPTRADDRFRILFDHSSDAHFIFDETGITDCNEATIALLKATDKSHVLSLHPAELSPEFQPDGRRSLEKSLEMDATARARGYHRFEWMHRKVDGDVFPVAVTLNSVEIDGRPVMIAVWHDLTEIKRVEHELRQRREELEVLHQQLVDANACLQRDLQAAAKVQQALLPTTLPEAAPVRMAWTFRPCEVLAGDLLNIFLLDERHVGLYLLDVSGHGVAASLLSVAASHFLSPHGPNSLLKMEPHADGSSQLAPPSEVARRLNQQFSSERSEQFFTLFYGILDLESYLLTYVNAGHPGPVVLRQDLAPRLLESSGFPIGIIDEAEYEDETVRFEVGDRFWLFSDGLPEAMNPAGELLGNERLIAQFKAITNETLPDAVRSTLRQAEDWTSPAGPQDDISLVAFELERARSR